jgi:lysophosphatidate acyltransferase
MEVLHAVSKYLLIPYAVLLASLYGMSFVLPPGLARLTTFVARCSAYIFSLGLAAAYGVVASVFLKAIGKPGLSQWTVARCFKWVIGLLTGVWFEVEASGEEYLLTRPAVYIGNHQS